MAAAPIVTNQFFYNHFLTVYLMPFDGDLFKSSSVWRYPPSCRSRQHLLVVEHTNECCPSIRFNKINREQIGLRTFSTVAVSTYLTTGALSCWLAVRFSLSVVVCVSEGICFRYDRRLLEQSQRTPRLRPDSAARSGPECDFLSTGNVPALYQQLPAGIQGQQLFAIRCERQVKDPQPGGRKWLLGTKRRRPQSSCPPTRRRCITRCYLRSNEGYCDQSPGPLFYAGKIRWRAVRCEHDNRQSRTEPSAAEEALTCRVFLSRQRPSTSAGPNLMHLEKVGCVTFLDTAKPRANSTRAASVPS